MYSPFPIPEPWALALALAGCLLCACGKQGETAVAPAQSGANVTQGTPVSALFPGGGSPPPDDPEAQKYASDQHAIAEGKRLFDWYNCAGCHFHGAGGIGPALMDNVWIYGGRMEQIYASIHQGRPNGMPSWGSKLSTTEIWELAAYVHDLSARNGANTGKPVPVPPPVPDGGAHEPQAPDVSATEIKGG